MTEPTPIAVPAGLQGLIDHDPEVVADLRRMRESLEARSSLDERTTELIRLGTLVAIGAPAESFTAHVTRLRAGGVPAADIWGSVMAVAPLVGVPRVIAATPWIAAALAAAEEGGTR